MGIFRFDNFAEQYAKINKRIHHDPEDTTGEGKAFFRMESIMRLKDFIAGNLSRDRKDPVMGVVTQYDVDLDPHDHKKMMVTHRIFFFTRQPQPDLSQTLLNERLAADAKAEGVDLAMEFISYLDLMKNAKPELKGLQLTNTSVLTVAGMYGDWWPTEIVITQIIPRPLCINPEHFTDTDEWPDSVKRMFL